VCGTRKKQIPEFKTADSTEYLDWPEAKRKKRINLKPTLRTISLRLPVSMKT